MTRRQVSEAENMWRARGKRSAGDQAYVAYALLLVAVVVIAPVIRALWISASSPSGLAMLTSADAATAASLFVAALWIGGLLVGSKRGPALLPPFLLHAVTSSGIRRSLTLRRPTRRSGAIIVTACVAGAALIGGVLLEAGETQLLHAASFAVVAASAGALATVAWLVGQVFPRAALIATLALSALAVISVSTPQTLAFVPWGWVGVAYAPAETGVAVVHVMGLVALTAAAIGITPALLNQLTGMQLSAQAAQWERATAHSFSLDFGAAAAVYEEKPRLGRRVRAIVPSRHRWVTFLLRDAVGQTRTPVRSLTAVAATAAAGALITLSLLPHVPAVLLAATAGAVVFGSTGPLTRGLQHAASVAGDYSIYGISDRRLILWHTLFPAAVLLVILPTAGAITALTSGASLMMALSGTVSIGILALALRLGNTLKGPLPLVLLAPVNTPVGDLSIIVKLGWAFGDQLLAILGAIAITLLPSTPIPLALLGIWVIGIIAIRWHRRR